MCEKIQKSHKTKRDFSKQRISKFFELPLNKAAHELGISESYLKRLCRKMGIKNWPYRQIKRIHEHVKCIETDLQNPKITSMRKQLLKELSHLHDIKKAILEKPEEMDSIEICPFYRGQHYFEFKVSVNKPSRDKSSNNQSNGNKVTFPSVSTNTQTLPPIRDVLPEYLYC